MATRTKERPAAPAKSPAQQEEKIAQPHGNGASPLSPEILKRLYSYMLKCRTVEERARNLFKQGKFAGNYYAAVGQEGGIGPAKKYFFLVGTFGGTADRTVTVPKGKALFFPLASFPPNVAVRIPISLTVPAGFALAPTTELIGFPARVFVS